jgi:hypothetical protein
MFYEMVGKFTIFFLLGLTVLLFTGLLLGFLLVKKKRLILPRLLLFTIDTFYFHMKKLAKKFGMGERIVDQIGIEVRNYLNEKPFSRVASKDRILVVPQCLRHAKCPARLDSRVGITCKKCGKCIVGDLKIEAERMGYGFYIVPGGRFVERIVRKVKPKAALGVACPKDLNIAMHDLAKTPCVVQGVPLIRDGCFQTEVDLKELLRRMKMGIEEGVVEVGRRSCTTEGGKTDPSHG